MTQNDSQVEAVMALCPFCGDDDAEVAESVVPAISGGKKRAVYCNGCFCEGPVMETDAAAIAAWNRRTALSALAAGKVEAIPEGWQLVPTEIIDRFPEINPSNYGHDDACALNAWGVELVLAALPASPSPLSADPESAVVGAAKEPVYWQWRRAGEQWRLDAYTFTSEPAVTAPGTEKRALYAGPVIAYPTLPHPALDRANAGERESESPLLKQVLDALRVGRVACEWVGKPDEADKIAAAFDAARALALPAADPERREGAEGAQEDGNG